MAQEIPFPRTKLEDQTTPLPELRHLDERQAFARHVEGIAESVSAACRSVVTVAQELESLVMQNAARVQVELNEHLDLAQAVKAEANKLGDTITQLRDVQALAASQRKTERNY